MSADTHVPQGGGRQWSCWRPEEEHEVYPAPGSVFDANRLWVTTAEQAAGKGRYPFTATCQPCGARITRGKDEDWRHA